MVPVSKGDLVPVRLVGKPSTEDVPSTLPRQFQMNQAKLFDDHHFLKIGCIRISFRHKSPMPP